MPETSQVRTDRWRATRQIPALYKDGLRRLHNGELGVRGWLCFCVLALAVIGDELTTGYMLRMGFSEGNPVAAAGFGHVGFWVFAVGSSLLVLAVAAPVAVARTTDWEMRILQGVVYLGILAKVGAVINNVLLYEHLWRGVRVSF